MRLVSTLGRPCCACHASLSRKGLVGDCRVALGRWPVIGADLVALVTPHCPERDGGGLPGCAWSLALGGPCCVRTAPSSRRRRGRPTGSAWSFNPPPSTGASPCPPPRPHTGGADGRHAVGGLTMWHSSPPVQARTAGLSGVRGRLPSPAVAWGRLATGQAASDGVPRTRLGHRAATRRPSAGPLGNPGPPSTRERQVPRRRATLPHGGPQPATGAIIWAQLDHWPSAAPGVHSGTGHGGGRAYSFFIRLTLGIRGGRPGVDGHTPVAISVQGLILRLFPRLPTGSRGYLLCQAPWLSISRHPRTSSGPMPWPPSPRTRVAAAVPI